MKRYTSLRETLLALDQQLLRVQEELTAARSCINFIGTYFTKELDVPREGFLINHIQDISDNKVDEFKVELPEGVEEWLYGKELNTKESYGIYG